MLNRCVTAVLVACSLALPGCVENDNGTPPPLPKVGTDKATPESAAVTPPFHARLLEIARTYPGYGRVDDQSRWAPTLCAAPGPFVSKPRFSASKDEGTHGRKLYFVFARHSEERAYHTEGKPNPVGQVIVKESWLPEEVKAGANAPDAARKDGRLYRAGRKGDLFIMYKLDPATPGTDVGWVYGTVTTDGKTVTSAGRVESCMKCHLKAPHDRLFGLPRE